MPEAAKPKKRSFVKDAGLATLLAGIGFASYFGVNKYFGTDPINYDKPAVTRPAEAPAEVPEDENKTPVGYSIGVAFGALALGTFLTCRYVRKPWLVYRIWKHYHPSPNESRPEAQK